MTARWSTPCLDLGEQMAGNVFGLVVHYRVMMVAVDPKTPKVALNRMAIFSLCSESWEFRNECWRSSWLKRMGGVG